MQKTKQITKSNRKYVPTTIQATKIISYFMLNNYQDFNTWQQISKSKCEFDYIETKTGKYLCKATLKFDDPSMPILSQNAQSRAKKNSKKKALHKIIEQLIYKGIVGYGFRDKQYIKKLPRRRKQSSEDDQLLSDSCQIQIQTKQLQSKSSLELQKLLFENKVSEALEFINENNFQKLWHHIVKVADFQSCIRMIRKLQNRVFPQNQDDHKFVSQLRSMFCEPTDDFWQEYCEKQFKDPSLEDLTDFLPSYQLQQINASISSPSSHKSTLQPELLPIQALYSQHASGNNLFQFFYPIENTFNYLRKTHQIEEVRARTKVLTLHDHLKELDKKMVMPIFSTEGKNVVLPVKIVDKLYAGIIAHSYNYNLVRCLLNIMDKQVKECHVRMSEIVLNPKLSPSQYYLEMKKMIASEFAYSLSLKIKNPRLLTLEGFLSPPSTPEQHKLSLFTFKPIESEQILQHKLPLKKPQLNNLLEFQEVKQFMLYDYVLVCSKLDESEYYIGFIQEMIPTIKVKIVDSENRITDINEKYPFVMYKIENGKLFRKMNKSLLHCVENSLNVMEERTCVILQPPTYPLTRVIAELLAQLVSKNDPETILIVTSFLDEVHAHLSEIGFKINKVNAKLKIDDKLFIKNQFICIVRPQAICTQALKNYHFTRIIVEGANRINQSFVLMAIDKGCEQLYLIGDQKNIGPKLSSPFNRQHFQQCDMFRRILNTQLGSVKTYTSQMQPHLMHPSILELLQKLFYPPLNRNFLLQTPQIKGFPWPSENLNTRLAFIHHQFNQSTSSFYLNQVGELASLIVQSVVESGFIDYQNVGCRVLDENMQYILQNKLQQIKKSQNGSKKDSIKNLNISTTIINPNGSMYIPYDSSSLQASNKDTPEQKKNIEKMVDFVTGSRYKQKDLIIFLCVEKKLYKLLYKGDKATKINELSFSYFNGCLQENRRGMIVIGDLGLLVKGDQRWEQILEWARHKQIIMKYKI